MPQNITDVDAFTDPIEAPLDADAVAAGTFLDTPQGLANRTYWLKQRLTPSLATALGTTRADAAALTNVNVILQSGGAARGVIFTTDLRGHSGRIWNPTGYALKLYPIVGETLLELKDVGVATPLPAVANDSPMTIPAYGVVDWASNVVGPGGGGTIPGSPAWTWIAKVSDDVRNLHANTPLFDAGAKFGSGNGGDTLTGYRKSVSSLVPAITGSTGTNVTNTLRSMAYERIGNIILCNFQVLVTINAGTTGQLQMALPYIPVGSSGAQSYLGNCMAIDPGGSGKDGAPGAIIAAGYDNPIHFMGDSAGAYAELYVTDTNGDMKPATVGTSITAGNQLFFHGSFSYFSNTSF